jgi:hypothetical protein
MLIIPLEKIPFITLFRHLRYMPIMVSMALVPSCA